MKTKIDINYPAVGRVSLTIGLLAILTLFYYWDDGPVQLLLAAAIALLLSGVGAMAYGCWRYDIMRHEEEERSREMKHPLH